MGVGKGDLRIWREAVVWGLSMLEANTNLARERRNVESSDSGDGKLEKKLWELGRGI